jgi:hypothetical protein
MKLFDFKFIILLGLALVIYFIYKELEFQRERLTYCEEKIKEIVYNKLNAIKDEVVGNLTFNDTNLKTVSIDKKHVYVKDNDSLNENNDLIDKDNEKLIEDNEKLIEDNEKLIEDNEKLIEDNNIINEDKNIINEDKNLSILLPEKTLRENRIKSTSDTSVNESSSLINTESSYTSSPSDSIILNSESKHLEIYSNDNDNNVETTISDSLIVSKLAQTDVKINQDLENMLNSNFLTKNSIKLLENKIDINSSQELENTINALKNELNNTDSDQKTVTSKNGSNLLSKMKLPELQSLAKKENLSLEKNINGHQKKKTKHELIEELSKI